MTTEEAIEILEEFIKANRYALENNKFHSAVAEEKIRDNVEAFEMAVKALKGEEESVKNNSEEVTMT